MTRSTYIDTTGQPSARGSSGRHSNLPRISVVTPSFNQGIYLQQTLDSVLGQGYPNLEYIVMDGGSTDSTTALLRQYEDQLSYVVSEPDNGQTDALKRGFARATGEILCWVNADDLLQPGSLFTVAEAFADDPSLLFLWGDARWIDSEGHEIEVHREIPFIRWVWLHNYNYIPQPAAFWRRSLYEEVGGLDVDFRMAMDSDLFLRMSHVAKLVHVPRVLASVRFHAAQRTWMERADSHSEVARLVERELGRRPRAIERLLKRMAAKVVRGVWRIWLKSGS